MLPMSDHVRRLHVANGLATTALIEAAGLSGRTSEWADPLYEGPVPALSDDALVVVRARYLAPEVRPVEETVAHLRRWRQVIEDADAFDELVLWYEHDLFDQLNLVQVLAWLAARPQRSAVSLVCIGAFPGRPQFKGLGELTPADLAMLFPLRRPVAHAQFETAARVWEAFRAESPERLDRLRRDGLSALPFLAPALERFLEEYPWTRDGLSRSERRLLHVAAEAKARLRDVFPRLHDGETAYYVTDGGLLDMVQRLSTSAPALLAIDPATASGRPFDRAIGITEAGRRVLDGALDRVAACGLDTWRGGVHLTADRLWRWNGVAGQLVYG